MIWWQMPTCISLYTDMRGVAPSKEPVLKGKHLVRRGIIPLLPYILCPTHCGIIAKVFKYKYTRRLWKKCVSSKSAPRHCVMCPKGVSSQKIVKMRQIGTFCVESFVREIFLNDVSKTWIFGSKRVIFGHTIYMKVALKKWDFWPTQFSQNLPRSLPCKAFNKTKSLFTSFQLLFGMKSLINT